MTATERLRAMLDERGVEHEGGERSLRWRDRYGIMMQAIPLADGELGMEVWSCTPEQAIAATLGDVDLAAENAKLRELVCHLYYAKPRDVTSILVNGEVLDFDELMAEVGLRWEDA